MSALLNNIKTSVFSSFGFLYEKVIERRYAVLYLTVLTIIAMMANLVYARIFMVVGLVLVLNHFRPSVNAWISAWRTVVWFGKRREIAVSKSSIKRPILVPSLNFEPFVKQQLPLSVVLRDSLRY